MSRILAVWCVLGAVLVGGTPAGAQGKIVKGKGYAATSVPPVINHPPPSYLGRANEHDVDQGVVFDGVTHYDLRHGADPDDKQRCRDHDYIHWVVHGATLEAVGQAHDSDPDDATIVSSEAWGAQIVHATVLEHEGDWGWIDAENELGFEYSYLISGGYIGEASVQLTGKAFDIKGKTHQFTLTEHTGEAVSQFLDRKFGLSLSDYRGASLGISNLVHGPTVSFGVSRTAGGSAGFRLAVSVNRRFGNSSGDSGASPSVMVTDRVSGQTPLYKMYDVYSAGNVVLRARTARAGSTVVVRLDKFKVTNSLLVRVQAHVNSDPPPPGPPPEEGPPPGPTTPGGEEPPPPPPPPPPDPGPTTPGSGDGSSPHVVVPWLPETVAFASWEPPHGLAGEPGTLAGRLRIRLSRAAPVDVAFALAADPPDALDLAGRDRLVVTAGRRWATMPFHGRTAGVATITLRLLDESGAPTAETLVQEVETCSIASYAETRLWATVDGKSWQPGRDVTVQAVTGEDLGRLHVGRLGFAGLATEETVVSLALQDEADILPDLPPTLTIPAGATRTSLPLRLHDAAGTATITLQAGAESVRILVLGRAREWRAHPVVRIPLGAVAPVPYELVHPEREARAVALAVADTGVAALAETDGTDEILPAERAWFFHLRGLTLGTTSVELTSPGLPPLTVPIEVVPPTVQVVNGRLQISALDASREGEIRLWAPEGVSIAGLELPAEAAEYLEVTGLGTGAVGLLFSPSPDLPDSLSLPIAFAAAPLDDLTLGVLDTMHAPEGGKSLVGYHIVVR
ncbi:MAG: hypothetical protein ACYTEZ_11330 [Planctomycetota bacterium]